ncbi:MAG: hypothetical protein JOY66_11725, partial [Acetobacteraceae bacterium]|nr:hypothetical protein [Acetobacteraceae bacterium]
MRLIDRAFAAVVVALALLNSAALGQGLPNGGEPMTPSLSPSVSPSQIASGALPSGVTIGLPALTSGTPTVNWPVSNIGSGALPSGVTIGAAQITS